MTKKNPSTKNINQGGRPTDYSDELSDKICQRLACGESMRSVSRDESMPAMTTLFRWLREKSEFRKQYDTAKEESADALTDDMLDIADNQVGQPVLDDKGKPLLKEDGSPVYSVDAPSVAHAKLRIDARKWTASKLKPKKYGDKIETKLTGSVGIVEAPALSADPVEAMKQYNEFMSS